jgi:hypothetical protein
MTIGAGVLLAVVLAVVFALGWVCGQVHAERTADLTAAPVPVPVSAGRHAAAWPRHLQGPRVLLDTAELHELALGLYPPRVPCEDTFPLRRVTA